MIIHYDPVDKIQLNNVVFTFGEHRDVVRAKLGRNYTVQDSILNFGDTTIDQKRDIYKNMDGSEYMFFLNYSADSLLRDLEVHYCDQIRIKEVACTFDDDLDMVAEQLKQYSSNWKKNDREYFFLDLQMAISNDEQMGGEGNTMSYFYCSTDVSHLMEE